MTALAESKASISEHVTHGVHEVHNDYHNFNVTEKVYGDPLSANDRDTAERRLLRKLDVRFMPTMVLVYFMHSIDVGLLFLSA